MVRNCSLNTTRLSNNCKIYFTNLSLSCDLKLFQNAAYKQTYGDDPVWKTYRRNFKGQFPPRKTRKTCIVCMQIFLILQYDNIMFLIMPCN